MGNVLQITLMVILIVEFMMGILGNGFIALVNCMDWVQRKKISTVDQILTALAISRIGYFLSILTKLLISALQPDLSKTGKIMQIINFPLIVTSHFSIWLATSLSVFYFLKIANFSNSIFLYLRWRVKRVISMTLLGSLVLLCLKIVLTNTYIHILVDGSKANMTCNSTLSSWSTQIYSLVMFNSSLFTIIPFAVSLMAFLLLIFSLWRHLRTMQHGGPGRTDASTTAHVKALQTMVTFLLLYTIFFLSFIVQIFSSTIPKKYFLFILFGVTEIAFPSIHPCVLILGDGKLRRASVSVLWWLRARSTEAEPPHP